MDNVAIGVAVGIAVAISTMIVKARSKKFAVAIEPALRAQGPMTLPALAQAIGMSGFMARGKVVMALNEMVTQGKVEVIPAPDGTPQLQKVNFIKYRLRA
jgi:hypothetical protein